MIYYFSGTGNSEYIAKKIAEYTNDSVRFIPRVFDEMQNDLDLHDEKIGIVFPVYAWQPPAIVMDFLEHVHVSKKSFCYAVATCGDSCGKAMQVLGKIFPFQSAYSISMPENYIALFSLDEEERMREKINVARQRLPQLASEINAKKSVYDVEEGGGAFFCTYILHPLFSISLLRSSFFSVDKTCVSCGECEKNCPLHVISFDGKKPVWHGKCQMCMSCIAKCPTHSIQCLASRGKARYVFNDFSNATFSKNERNKINESAAANFALNENFHTHEGTRTNFDANENLQTKKNVGENFATAENLQSNESVHADFVKIGTPKKKSAEPFFELYSAYEFEEKKANGAAEKMLGKIRCFADAALLEVHIKPNECYKFSGETESLLYAVKGRARIFCDDGTAHDFLESDIIRAFGKTVSIFNREAGEFICLVLKSE